MKFFGWDFGETEEQARLRFKTRKWRIVEATALSFAMSGLGVVVVWREWWAPDHLQIGLILYILSYIPYFYKVYLTRQTWIEYKTYDYAYDFIKRQKIWFAVATIVVASVFTYIYIVQSALL